MDVTSLASGPLRRRFFDVGGRRVHAWTGGSGPPVLLIHGSPGNSALVRPLAERLAARHAVLAPDTPGFGLSDPLPGADVDVGRLADAAAALLDHLGLRQVIVYGTHTGAAIGLELARRHPARVAAFVLDGVPVFTPAEQEPLLSPSYMPPFEPDELGGHYARTWTRFHDQFVWFPWFRREVACLNEADGGAPEDIHLWVEMFFQCAGTYRGPYRAAIAYGEQAIAAAAAVSSPGIYVAHASDMLFPHLDRLPAPKPGQRIERMDGAGDWNDAMARLVAELPGPAGPASPHAAPQSANRFFADLPHGQVMVRRCGSGARRVLLLHDAPGAGGTMEPLAEELAAHATVLLPDLPGCGESDPLARGRQPTLAEYADAVAELLAHCGEPGPLDVHGTGCGSALALELRARHPGAVASLYVDDVPEIDAAGRRALQGRLAPPIEIVADGSHWYRTWLMLRRSLVYRPWFSRSRADLRREPASFDGTRLHAWTCEVMRSHATYHHLVEAVIAHDVRGSVADANAVRGRGREAAAQLAASLR